MICVWYEVERQLGLVETRGCEGTEEECIEALSRAVREYGPVRIVHVEGKSVAIKAGEVWRDG